MSKGPGRKDQADIQKDQTRIQKSFIKKNIEDRVDEAV